MSEPGELQAAKAELQRKKNILLAAIQRHDKLLESSSPESQEALKAELGVAKAELGVAKAKFGVAEAELDAAKAKEDTPERQLEIAKAEEQVAKAEEQVAKAEEQVALAELKEAAAQAKRDGDQYRLKRLQEAIDAKISAPHRLAGQFSDTLVALNFCALPNPNVLHYPLVSVLQLLCSLC